MAFDISCNASLQRPVERAAPRRFERSCDVTKLCSEEIYLARRASLDFLPEPGVYEGAGSITSTLAGGLSFNGRYAVAGSEEMMHEVLVTLEECQKTLALGGDRETAQLVAVAILELRIKLNRIPDSEFRLLCDAMLQEAEASHMPYQPRPEEGPRARGPVSLKLVK
jgi:hypothetical protein